MSGKFQDQISSIYGRYVGYWAIRERQSTTRKEREYRIDTGGPRSSCGETGQKKRKCVRATWYSWFLMLSFPSLSLENPGCVFCHTFWENSLNHVINSLTYSVNFYFLQENNFWSRQRREEAGKNIQAPENIVLLGVSRSFHSWTVIMGFWLYLDLCFLWWITTLKMGPPISI